MKRVGWNYYFQKYESNGGTREYPREPSNTTLQWFFFQKNIILYVYNIVHGIYTYFFPNIFMLLNERVLVPFMSTYNNPFIFQVFFNNTSGTIIGIHCYCRTVVKTPNIIVITYTKPSAIKKPILHDFPMIVQIVHFKI